MFDHFTNHLATLHYVILCRELIVTLEQNYADCFSLSKLFKITAELLKMTIVCVKRDTLAFTLST